MFQHIPPPQYQVNSGMDPGIRIVPARNYQAISPRNDIENILLPCSALKGKTNEIFYFFVYKGQK